MARATIERTLRAEWSDIVRWSKVTHPMALEGLPMGSLDIIGTSTKVELGEELASVLTGIVYLAPSTLSGRNVCPWSTRECESTCLGTQSGRMRFDGVRRAQVWKTALRFGAPELYFDLLSLDLIKLRAKAIKLGLQAAARLDGTSDLGDAFRVVQSHDGIVFYDYTKSVRRAFDSLGSDVHVTLSFSGHNRTDCVDFLQRGGNVAVPFDVAKGQPLPAFWNSFPVLDADAHDFRPLDPRGHVAGLRLKGPKANRERMVASGWAQR